MRRLLYSCVIVMLIATLATGTEVRKLGSNDLELQQTDGGAGETTTSPGGKVVTRIHGGVFPWDNSYTRTIRPGDIITKGPWVDVRAHGEITFGSGATEAQRTANTNAINTAIVAARNPNAATRVLIPSNEGPIYINGTILTKDGVILSGESKWYGGLYTDNAITMISSSGLGYLHVENLHLKGNGGVGSIGIKVPASGSLDYISNVHIHDIETGIETRADTVTIINANIDNTTYGIQPKTVGNAIDIFSPHIYNSTYGIRSGLEGGCRGINVFGGVIQGNTYGITGNANVYSLSVNGTYFEGQSTQDISYSGRRLFINGGDFVSNSGTLTEHISSNSPHTTIIAPHFAWGTEPASYYIAGGSSSTDMVIINATWDSTPTFGKKYSLAGARSSVIEGGVSYQKIVTFADNATTPSITGGTRFRTANTGATTIVDLPSPVDGQRVSIVFTDNLTTIANNENIKLQGAVNFVATQNDMITLIYTDDIGWVEESRSVN